LWFAYRITEKQKAGKARNIKEKQLKNSRSTDLKQLVELHSSLNDNKKLYKRIIRTLENALFSRVLSCSGQL